MKTIETLESIRRKIDGAYGSRDDYPPLGLMSFDDRPCYHRYVIKLINEEIEKAEKGE
ncbi:unnamed protein product [marine sediment metagenome]|uniref:Uncharacterized protein n=1 Tax=marine sediment metagenome TaxID=412755 RepID=X0Y750_9ZZZZ